MSESNRDPNEEIEVKGVELPEGWSDADFEDDDEPKPLQSEQPPAEETPDPVDPPATDDPPAPRVPPLFSDVTDPAERKALIEDAIAALPPEERVGLKGVDEIIRGAHALGEDSGARRTREQIQNDSTEAERIEAAATFIDRAKEFGSSPDFKWQDEIGNVEKYAADQRQNEFVGEMSRGIGAAFKAVGITTFPSELISRVNAAETFDQVVAEYVNYGLAVGADLGKRLQSETHAAQTEADQIAGRARAKSAALGELAKEKRIRISKDAEGYFAELLNDTPPVIDGTVPSGGVGVDEAEWTAAMNALNAGDPDPYDRIMADPNKAAFIHRLQAEAVGARS